MTNKIRETIRAAGGLTILAEVTGLSRESVNQWALKGFPENGKLDSDEIIDILLTNVNYSNGLKWARGKQGYKITREELKQASRALKGAL